MNLRLYILSLFCLFVQISFGQSRIVIDEDYDKLNKRITQDFSYYIDKDNAWGIEGLVDGKIELGEPVQFQNEVENLDFTTSAYWIHFSISNQSGKSQSLILETARPITNEVFLYQINNGVVETFLSGDGVSFSKKAIQINNSVLPIEIPNGAEQEYWLKLSSDGEIISLPIILWESEVYNNNTSRSQFGAGLYYGVFLFVILIYFIFYLLLKDQSFFVYVLYVLCGGLLQFSLEGYAHQFFFTSGGYWTQHFILLISGATSSLVILYARLYLRLNTDFKSADNYLKILGGMIVLCALTSMIPGTLYQIMYPIINGISLIGTISILIIAIMVRRRTGKVSPLFIEGLAILIAGAVIFILGNFSVIDMPSFTQVSLKYATLVEVMFLSILMAQKYKTLQDEKEEAQKLLVQELEGANEKLELLVNERTKDLAAKTEELREKNEDILDSIKYAERIQRAILPSQKKIDNLVKDAFVFFKPRDIVSGDFYWMEEVSINGKKMLIYATADCTGHGVPGAFVSIVGNCFLTLSSQQNDVQTPGEVLDFLNEKVFETFNSQYSDETIRDGMDIALCMVDFEDNKLYFSGAKNPIYIVRNQELYTLKGDKSPIGLIDENQEVNFNTQEFVLQKGDVLYTFSDGYADQFGGPKGKKFMYGKLKKLLIKIAPLPMNEQEKILEEEFLKWKGDVEQLDDVLLIGIRNK